MSELFDQRLIQRTREHAASDYLRVSVFQQQIEQELIDRLALLTIDVENVLVMGAGNRFAPGQIAQQFSPRSICIVDTAQGMLSLDVDGESANEGGYQDTVIETTVSGVHEVPLPNASVDLVFSNFYMSWADDSMTLIEELFRVLKPGGCVHFSCLGPDSFEQLRAAWQQTEPDNPYHVIVPPDMHDVGDALVGVGFAEPVMDRTNYQLSYSSDRTLFDDLRANAVRNFFRQRSSGLTSRRRWQHFLDRLRVTAQCEEDSSRYLLTLEAIIGQAWKPLKPKQKRREDGSVAIPAEQMIASLTKHSETD